jgi:formate/nitrite transporter FocA (FNT family)
MAPNERQKAKEEETVEDLSAPKALIIHEVVRRQGEEELERPPASLLWSSLAGGITIMVSVIAQGALQGKIPPDAPWRTIVSEAGYSLGFIMVIIGRMQLFTEQTIVTVLPVMAEPTLRKLGGTARLWGIVLAGNLIGTCAAAAIIVYLQPVTPELLHSMLAVSAKLLDKGFGALLAQAVPAGFLIASVAWLRAGISSGEIVIIFILTWAIALGDFTHVIAGSAETFLLVFAGQVSLGHALGGILLPALIGNILGGTGLFALLAYAQVHQEID